MCLRASIHAMEQSWQVIQKLSDDACAYRDVDLQMLETRLIAWTCAQMLEMRPIAWTCAQVKVRMGRRHLQCCRA